MRVFIVPNEADVPETLWNIIVQYVRKAVIPRRVFRIGLSGGSLIKYLTQGASSADARWDKWELYLCDERYVPEEDVNSTYGQYKRVFIPETELQPSQFLVIDTKLNLKDCAEKYEKDIYEKFNLSNATPKIIPQFDLLLLGMGPDGHTCSLFPGHSLLSENDLLIAPISDSPKPPSNRITMTYPLINNAKVCIFIVCGAEKADMVKRILVDKEPLPAGLVKPKNDAVLWILDAAAAHLVKDYDF